ncbi:MAG: iron ABC transporter permease [Thermoanaerobaculia bacterium]|nr:iron ABC transporter permease [Thermoanaerobaculia bacterium]
MTKPRRPGDLALVVALAWLALWPLVITAWAAFDSPDGPGAAWREFAARDAEWSALGRSLLVSFVSVALAAAIGVPLAFLFARAEFPGRRVLAELVALPVALPPLVGVVAFLYLWGESGVGTRLLMAATGLEQAPWRLHGLGAILVVHAYSMYVYFYLFTRAALARFDGAMVEAAASLGAGALRRFVRVVLPALRPALTGAAVLTFLTALGSFSAPYIFGGNYRVMTTQILATKQNGEVDLAEVETVVLTLVALAVLVVARRLDRGEAARRRGTAARPRRAVGRGTRLAVGAAGWGLAALLLAPHLTLLLLSFVPRGSWSTELLPPVLSTANYRILFGSAEALRPVGNSLAMAAVATALALGLGFAAARATRRGGLLGRAADLLVSVPWAVPATAFAVALATTHSVVAPWFGRFLLVGTLVILPLAYLARSLPATGRAALAGLAQLDPGLEEAAASLGAGKLRTLWRVTLPVLRPALVSGALLAFLTSFGDFVASIVLYTFETRPIAIEILARLRLQETGVAAAYGVLLTVLSATIFLVWGREREDA